MCYYITFNGQNMWEAEQMLSIFPQVLRTLSGIFYIYGGDNVAGFQKFRHIFPRHDFSSTFIHV